MTESTISTRYSRATDTLKRLRDAIFGTETALAKQQEENAELASQVKILEATNQQLAARAASLKRELSDTDLKLSANFAVFLAQAKIDVDNKQLEPPETYPLDRAALRKYLEDNNKKQQLSQKTIDAISTLTRHVPHAEFLAALKRSVQLFIDDVRKRSRTSSSGSTIDIVMIIEDIKEYKSNFWTAELIAIKTALAVDLVTGLSENKVRIVDVTNSMADALSRNPRQRIFVYADDALYSGKQTAATISKDLEGTYMWVHGEDVSKTQHFKNASLSVPSSLTIDSLKADKLSVYVLAPFCSKIGIERVKDALLPRSGDALHIRGASKPLSDIANPIAVICTDYLQSMSEIQDEIKSELTMTYFDHKIGDTWSVWLHPLGFKHSIPNLKGASSVPSPYKTRKNVYERED